MRVVLGIVSLVCAVVLDGCATSPDQSEDALALPLPIEFSSMYSAYDGDHTFQVTPFVPSSTGDAEHSPIVASTVRWTVDRYFLDRDDFESLPHGALLTTKRAGKTNIRVSAMTQDGENRTGEATLFISHATRNEWEAGEAYYNQTGGIRERLLAGFCGVSVEMANELSELKPGCSKCHDACSSYARPPTPTQTAGLDDDELLQVFSNAAEPPSGLSSSQFLRRMPEPECTFQAFHTWELTESEKKGLVWQLRAIPPAAYALSDRDEHRQ
jgi:hypothetical protein